MHTITRNRAFHARRATLLEEILNRLAGIRELQVAARTSVFSFKGQNQDIRKIAQQLGVETVLEGSVRIIIDEFVNRYSKIARVISHSIA